MQIHDEDFDIISLTPDMSALWGNLLKKLREKGEQALYIACTEQCIPEFLAEEIILSTSSEGVYDFLIKHKKKFDDILGGGILQITLGRKRAKDNTKTKKLKELFGELLTVK